MFHYKVLSYDHLPGGNFLDLGSGLGRACVAWALLVLGNPVAQQFLAIGASRAKERIHDNEHPLMLDEHVKS